LTRRSTAAISRRASLLAVGITAIGAAHPARGAVEKSSKKSKKIKTKKCKKQVGQCSAFLQEACQGEPVCEGAISCCGLFATCNASDAVSCIFTNSP
jgi:hypothetical protein